MKRTIDVFDYAGTICHALKKGILLTTKSGNHVNTMTIGWGHLGFEWNKPVFIAFVRESRYTKQLLEANGEFTVNIPLEKTDGDVLRYCGTKSGRDTDKISDLDLTLVTPNRISVPAIQEFPLTLECKLIYKQAQDLSKLPDSIIERFYPASERENFRDYHIAYYGEIVDAYIIEA